jgi:peptidoglycan/xylan/chitin deacetylase (PgdA/CDA1 family)
MDELVEAIQNGRPLPCNSLVFTFDDGYVDNYIAAKILKRHGISGTFYITAGCIESDEPLWIFEVRTLVLRTHPVSIKLRLKDADLDLPLKNDVEKRDAVRQITRLVKSHDIETRVEILNQVRSQLGTRDLQEAAQRIMLTWGQLKEMVADGMTVGGHTMTHCNLPHAKPAEAAFEVRECKAVLEAHLGITVRHFAYPNGGASTYYNEGIKALLMISGYLSATTSQNGFVGLNSDLLELKRIRTTEPLHEIAYELEGERFLKRRYAGT